jgi:tRNA-binding protein
MNISFEQFANIDLRSGTVVKAEAFPKAKKPAYKVWVDFGPELGIRQTSAQVTVNYSLESLVGRQVVGVVNIGSRNIAGFESQFLMVGFEDEKGAVSLVSVDPKVPNGKRLF